MDDLQTALVAELKKIGIVLSDVPTEWKKDLKKLVTEQQDLEILAEVTDHLEVLVHAKELHADVVILSQLPNGHEPGICSHLLTHCPHVVILLLPIESGPGLLLQMRPARQELHDLSCDAILTILRRAED